MNDTRKIKTLHSWDKNPRSISPKAFERLKNQLSKFGQYKPLLITEDGTVLGGNMRLKAMEALGWDDIWVSIVEADNEKEKIEYAFSDNDRAGKYEQEDLLSLVEAFPEVEWGDYAIDLKEPELVSDFMDQFSEVEEDEVPEVAEGEPDSKLGEIYELGRHRLMCGDATDMGDITLLLNNQAPALMLTDPPYGISVVGKDGHIGGGTEKIKVNTYKKVINDDIEMDLNHLLPLAKKSIIWGGNYLAYKLPKGGRWLVWDKDRNEGLSFSDCELAWTNIDGVIVKKYTVRWDGYSREGEKKESLHPTMKSLKLLGQILNDYIKEDDLILDVFGGSGSTLIAAEQTNRTCYMMELDPKYCDVIRKRYDNFISNNNKTTNGKSKSST